jgi:hypothetical protein
MNIPPSGIVDCPSHNLYKPLDDPVYGCPDALKTISNIASQYVFKITKKIVALLAAVLDKSLE